MSLHTFQLAQAVPNTEAEGPGHRFAIWVQGCSIRCTECCNPEMFKAGAGTETNIEAFIATILETDGIEGVSFLGGEPFEQPQACAQIATAVRAAGLSVMVFTGYTLKEIQEAHDEHRDALLALCDLMVDGRYEAAMPEPAGGRRWIGSSNQVMHFLSDAYDPGDPQFVAGNTVELRLDGSGIVTINGWPADEKRKRQ